MKLGLSQMQAAKRIGVGSTTFRFWEYGWKEPDWVYHARIEAFLRQ